MRGVLPMPCVAVIQWRKRRWLVASDRQSELPSNDYLGLSHHPQIIRAWKQGAEQFGVGSGGSGHVSGYSVAHQALKNWPSGWAIRGHCCLSLVLPLIRRSLPR